VLVLLVALAVCAVAEDSGVVGAAPVPEHAIDELDQFDADVFSADPVAQAMPPPPSSSESDASLDSEEEENGVHDSDSSYSFRAMQAATDVAGSGLISEKAAETHRMAQKFLQDTKASADDMFAEINREQQILMAKRALVARQKESITESQRSLKRLSALIKDNKGILKKNEAALRGASDDLLKLISTYQSKLKDGLNSEIGAAKPKKAKKAKKAAPKKVVAKKTAKKQPKKATMIKSVKKATAAPKVVTKTTDKKNKVPAAAAVAKKAAKAASAKKVKFMQIDDSDSDSDSDETDSDSDSETDSDAEDSDEAEESEESEQDEDVDSENENESESDNEDEELSEESLLEVRAGLLDEDNIDLLGLDRTAPVHDDIDMEDNEEVDMHAGNLLPGLGAPPKLYKPDEDELL